MNCINNSIAVAQENTVTSPPTVNTCFYLRFLKVYLKSRSKLSEKLCIISFSKYLTNLENILSNIIVHLTDILAYTGINIL